MKMDIEYGKRSTPLRRTKVDAMKAIYLTVKLRNCRSQRKRSEEIRE